MTNISKIIKNTTKLNEVLRYFSKSKFIAIDTEFVREKTFYPKLCLIQISNGEVSYCIDTLSKKIKLDQFFDLLSDRRITKVFHSGKQDVEIFFNLSGQIPNPVFDTQIASMFIGFPEQYSYDKLVFSLTSIKLDKKLQYSNWETRPLSEEKIKYALNDVIYLSKIYPVILKKITKIKREKWLLEETNYFYDERTFKTDSSLAGKKIKTSIKTPEIIYRIYKLAEWREEKAKNFNKTRKSILNDHILIDICKVNPNNIQELLKLFPSKNRKAELFNHEIIKVLENSNLAQENELQIHNKIIPNMKDKNIIEMLKILLKIISEENGLPAPLIATSSEIYKLVCSKNSKLKLLKGWRKKIYGDEAIKLIEGKTALYIKNKKTNILEV